MAALSTLVDSADTFWRRLARVAAALPVVAAAEVQRRAAVAAVGRPREAVEVAVRPRAVEAAALILLRARAAEA
jgi:hypothetical protein